MNAWNISFSRSSGSSSLVAPHNDYNVLDHQIFELVEDCQQADYIITLLRHIDYNNFDLMEGEEGEGDKPILHNNLPCGKSEVGPRDDDGSLNLTGEGHTEFPFGCAGKRVFGNPPTVAEGLNLQDYPGVDPLFDYNRVLIFKKIFSRSEARYRRTMVHELGHLLGLADYGFGCSSFGSLASLYSYGSRSGVLGSCYGLRIERRDRDDLHAIYHPKAQDEVEISREQSVWRIQGGLFPLDENKNRVANAFGYVVLARDAGTSGDATVLRAVHWDMGSSPQRLGNFFLYLNNADELVAEYANHGTSPTPDSTWRTADRDSVEGYELIIAGFTRGDHDPDPSEPDGGPHSVVGLTSTATGDNGKAVAATTQWTLGDPAVVYAPPSQPVLAYAVRGDGEVRLEWDAVPGATSYRVYWTTSSFSDVSTLCRTTPDHSVTLQNYTDPVSVTASSAIRSVTINLRTPEKKIKTPPTTVRATVTRLADGHSYSFRLCANTYAGEAANDVYDFMSDPSAEATVRLDQSLHVPRVTAMARTSRVDLTWEAITGATDYRIYWSSDRSDLDDLTNTLLQSRTITSAEHIANDSGATANSLANGTTFYFRVVALANGQTSDPSLPVHATPIQAPTVSATAGDAAVSLSWKPVPTANKYQAYWSKASFTSGQSWI